MAYYLKCTTAGLLQISGITGNATFEYTIKEDVPANPGTNRYIFDPRRTPDSTTTTGSGWLYEGSDSVMRYSDVSNPSIDGVPSSSTFSGFGVGAVADTTFTFDVTSAAMANGCVCFFGRHNNVNNFIGFTIADLSITDSNGTHTFTWPASGGSGTVITSDTGLLTAKLVDTWPTDDSQWVFYSAGGGGISATITETLEPFADSISVTVSANISAAITESLEPFADSISASISGAVSASIIESLQPFSDSISADVSANISVALTEELQPFADSISATVTPAVGINAAITETLQPFDDSIAANVSANIAAAITEQLQTFADSIGVNLSANIELTITETLDAFSDSISVQMPQVVISSKNTVRIKPRNNTIRVQSRNKTMRVR